MEQGRATALGTAAVKACGGAKPQHHQHPHGRMPGENTPVNKPQTAGEKGNVDPFPANAGPLPKLGRLGIEVFQQQSLVLAQQIQGRGHCDAVVSPRCQQGRH